jgi:hypothetical protein
VPGFPLRSPAAARRSGTVGSLGYPAGHGEDFPMTDYVIAAVVLAFIVVVLVLLKRAERRRP